MATAASDISESLNKFLPLPDGKTFWDDGNFDVIVKRIEQGKK